MRLSYKFHFRVRENMKVAGKGKAAASRASWRGVVLRGQHYRHIWGRPFASPGICGRRKQGAFLGARAPPLGVSNPQNPYHERKALDTLLVFISLGFIVVSFSWGILLTVQSDFSRLPSKAVTYLIAQALYISDDSDPAFMEKQCSLGAALEDNTDAHLSS